MGDRDLGRGSSSRGSRLGSRGMRSSFSVSRIWMGREGLRTSLGYVPVVSLWARFNADGVEQAMVTQIQAEGDPPHLVALARGELLASWCEERC